jgi:hypothetical protein
MTARTPGISETPTACCDASSMRYASGFLRSGGAAADGACRALWVIVLRLPQYGLAGYWFLVKPSV